MNFLAAVQFSCINRPKTQISSIAPQNRIKQRNQAFLLVLLILVLLLLTPRIHPSAQFSDGNHCCFQTSAFLQGKWIDALVATVSEVIGCLKDTTVEVYLCKKPGNVYPGFSDIRFEISMPRRHIWPLVIEKTHHSIRQFLNQAFQVFHD